MASPFIFMIPVVDLLSIIKLGLRVTLLFFFNRVTLLATAIAASIWVWGEFSSAFDDLVYGLKFDEEIRGALQSLLTMSGYNMQYITYLFSLDQLYNIIQLFIQVILFVLSSLVGIIIYCLSIFLIYRIRYQFIQQTKETTGVA